MLSKLKYKNKFIFSLYSLFVELRYRIFSDEQYRKRIYKKRYNKDIDLNDPKSFNEKIAFRTLYDRNDLYTKLADKLLVREYVKERIGEQYLIKLLKTYNNVNDINLSELPEQFVLKCNHDVGSVVICTEKKSFDLHNAKKKLNCAMKVNIYKLSREWHYKNIKPIIICEEFLNIFFDKNNSPEDYKFHCFNGKVKYIEVQFSRFSDNRYINVYDSEWNLQPFKMGYDNTLNETPKPDKLDDFVMLAGKLAEGIDYCRVDFYLTKDNQIKFGEMTFTPCNGLDIFIPSCWQYKFSEDWVINK